jgi:hypothetical protein
MKLQNELNVRCRNGTYTTIMQNQPMAKKYNKILEIEKHLELYLSKPGLDNLKSPLCD